MSNDDVNVHFDKAHGGRPDHVDLTKPMDIGGERGSHKIEISGTGDIIREQVWQGDKKTDI